MNRINPINMVLFVVLSVMLFVMTIVLSSAAGTWTLVLFTSIWVYIDASIVYQHSNRNVCNTQPFAWFALCILFWIVGFPWYMAGRVVANTDSRNPPFVGGLLGTILVAEVVGFVIAAMFFVEYMF